MSIYLINQAILNHLIFFLIIAVLEIELSDKEIKLVPSESSTIQVDCRLTCACGGATVRWVANGRENLPEGVKEVPKFSKRSSTLMFDEITSEANGSYSCIAESPDPDTEQTVDTFVLIVLEPASVAVTPSEVIVPEGEPVNLTCTANREVQFFSWSYLTSEGPLPATATFYEVSDTVSILTVSNVRRDINDGQYFCEAFFEITSDHASSTGNIIQKCKLNHYYSNCHHVYCLFCCFCTAPIVLVCKANLVESFSFYCCIFFPLYPHLADLTVKLIPDLGDVYQLTTGSSIDIQCRVGCTCDGAEANWKIDTPLPTGLRIIEGNSRVEWLRASSATVGMSGNYTCEVTSRVTNDRVSRQIQIVVT